MGIGCVYKIFITAPEEDEYKMPNSCVNKCCTADNLEVRFTAKSGNLHYAYLVCKTCGNKFVYQNNTE